MPVLTGKGADSASSIGTQKNADVLIYMRYRSKSTGLVIEAVQITNDTFVAPRPGLEHFLGVLYDRRQRFALVKNEIANIGDWIIRDPFGNLSVCGAAAFEREYNNEMAVSNVIPFRRSTK